MRGNKRLLNKILIKLANGFEYTEITEEYTATKDVTDKESLVLSKKKITTHYVAPDMLAIKMLLENDGQKITDFSTMTDEELVALKNKLIKEMMGGESSGTS